MNTIEIIIVVIVAVLILRAIAVRKLGGPSQFSGLQGRGMPKPHTQSGGLRISNESDAATIEAVRQMLEGGRFFEAVKYVRETKKITLKEAKLFVESIEKNEIQKMAKSSRKEKFGSAEIATRAKHLKEGGHVIEAVKFVREQTGMGLAEAKRFVDSL